MIVKGEVIPKVAFPEVPGLSERDPFDEVNPEGRLLPARVNCVGAHPELSLLVTERE